MRSKYDSIASTNYLSNLCRDDTPLRGRIALLSVQNEVLAEKTDQLITFIEYTQLIALLLIAEYKIYGSQVAHPLQLYNSFLYIAKIISPGNLLPINKEGQGAVIRVIATCAILFLFRVALFVYIILLAFKRKNGSTFLINLWQWIFRLQGKVLHFIFASFYVNTFDGAKSNKLGFAFEGKYTIMVICLVLLILEFSFSLILATQFNNVLPYKRFSAAKDNFSELSVLIQKFIIHVLRRIFGFHLTAAIWSYNIITIILGAARVYHTFNKLQVYNFKGLKFQLRCFISTLTFGFCSLAQAIMHRKHIDMNFIIITWVILTILAIKLADASLERRIHILLFEKGLNKNRSPQALAHKVIFLKEVLKRNQVPVETTDKCDLYHLLYSTLNSKIAHSTYVKSFNLNCKETRNHLLTNYFEELMVQFPKDDFLKLFSAYRYARKSKLYGLSIKTLAEIRSSSPSVIVSKAILKHFIKTKTQADYQSKTYMLNLYDFCKNLGDLNKLKLRMITQAKLQWSICNEIVSLKPNLSKIRSMGQNAYHQKQKIQSSITKFFTQAPESFVQPYSLYSAYSLFMEYCPEEYSKYQEIFFKKCQTYEKWFENGQISSENILQDKTFWIVVSGEKETNGQTLYSSPQLAEVLGRNLIGSPSSACVPPFLRARTEELIKSLSGRNALAIQNSRRFQFFHHAKGYMIPMNYYLNINPSFYGGLSYIFMCRGPDSTNKEYILLNEEGEIESFTKNLGDLLGLFSNRDHYSTDSKILMTAVCPEFVQIQQAYNVVNSPEKVKRQQSKVAGENSPPELDLEEAQKLISVFSSEQGKNISFLSIKKHHNKFAYKCTIQLVPVGTKTAKIITLEKLHDPLPQRDEDSSSNHISADEKEDEDLSERETYFDRFKQITTRNDAIIQNTVSSARNLLSPKSPKSPRTPLIFAKKTPAKNEIPHTSFVQPSKDNQKGWLEKYKPHWVDQTKTQTAKIYKQALEKPYYPFFYRVLITLLYSIFALIFAMYLYMTINMHQGISDLHTSKQILRMAEARNNYLGITYGNARFVWSFATESNSFTQMITTNVASLPRLLLYTKVTLQSLQKKNNDLFVLTTSLDTQEQVQLFQKDVRIFDTVDSQSHLNLTNFQATDWIIDTSLKYLAIAKVSLSQAVPYMKVVLRNVLNDLLAKNIKISAAFQNSLHNKKNHFVTWIINYFAVAFSFLVIVVILFIYALCLQAKSEGRNMLAITKLKPEAIQNLTQEFLIFRNIVFESDCSQNQEATTDPFYAQSLKRTSDLQSLPMQYPNFRGLWLGYYLKFAQVIFLILVIFGLFLSNFIVFKNYLDHLSTKADQILFIEQMSSKFGVLSGSFFEMISENNSTLINNMPASESVTMQITQISGMINSVSDILGIGASENNPLIQSILYGDACPYLSSVPLHFTICRTLANYQAKSGLVNLLNSFEASLNLVYTDFVQSNRSSEALQNLQIETFNKVSAPAVEVLQLLNTMIAEVLNKDFENLVDTSQSLNITANTGILILIVLECFIIHFLIINKLKKKEMKFKQILELFPASVILPNFILKSYIIKTSDQNFNLSLDHV